MEIEKLKFYKTIFCKECSLHILSDKVCRESHCKLIEFFDWLEVQDLDFIYNKIHANKVIVRKAKKMKGHLILVPGGLNENKL